MAKKKLIKSQGNFTLKRLHQSGNYGNIFERDYTTISNVSSISNGQLEVGKSPTFKLSIGVNSSYPKKYKYGNWVTNPQSCGDSLQWTLNCMPAPEKKNNKIIPKPNTKRLSDYVCYSSSYELIRSSISKVIANFPAELYITNTTLEDSGIVVLDKMTNTDIYAARACFVIDNPMMIDIQRLVAPEESIISPLRYFCATYDKYVIKENDTDSGFTASWQVNNMQDKGCLQNGDLLSIVKIGPITVYCFYMDSGIIYLSDGYAGYRIRPNNEAINDFFESLDDFEKNLLNRDTNYTAIFETYIETEDSGWTVRNISYTWPTTKGGWNIAISGIDYLQYTNSLSTLAIGYDELYTNAIWRKMTHEAISNLDLTLQRNNENYILNSSKIKDVLNVIGRQFDDIKKYADTIKSSNCITYTQDNNTPDYFLSDNLEMSGWESKAILSEVSSDIITTPLYGSRTNGYNATDANNEFMRRLQLNSKNIFAEKGTKKAIEDLLAIFGLHSTDWLMNYYGKLEEKHLRKAFSLIEFVYVADGYIYDKSAEEIVPQVKKINALKDNFDDSGSEDLYYKLDEYQGLPVAEVTMGDKTCIVPWFDKNKIYDSDLYFQMKGGWARNDGNNVDEVSKYSQTRSNIYMINKLNDLYYLEDWRVSEDKIYFVKENETYYKVKNRNTYYLPESWRIADSDEIADAESIIEDNKGNNPHHGDYDSGLSYLEGFGMFFKDASFDSVREDEVNLSFDYGFNISRQADSTKCLFFGDEKSTIINGLRGENKILPYNFFGGNPYSEAGSLSIINSKELHIVFDDTCREFIENEVLHYLKQIIPSTTIFSYSFEHLDDNNEKVHKARTHKVICDNKICSIYGIV